MTTSLPLGYTILPTGSLSHRQASSRPGKSAPHRLSDWERMLLGGVGWEAWLCPALGPERDTEKETPDEELC
ncbi:hypothetical protein FQA47_023206 [Oryzias melastigma]|uniref:Uncharacterized protein n=1 Tax=Oryzias melastigma TaxID=30732 RepID=A0A834CR05_ORYME|nr:hypothetical protein FQA47_023206 [Oryzias melastigma]